MSFFEIFNIIEEAYYIIRDGNRVFGKIVVSMILPLTIIFLAHMEISNFLFGNFIQYLVFLHRYRDNGRFPKLFDLITPKWTFFWLFNISYVVFLFIFSLLATSAVVYTVACMHVDRNVSFKHIINVVPKVWKRLLVTFFCVFASFFAYNVLVVCTIFFIVMILWIQQNPSADLANGPTFLFIFLVLYFIGLLYLSIVLQLSSVVSVLEESYGFKAMAKSKSLLRGKMVVATILLSLINVSLMITQQAFLKLVVHGIWFGILGKVIFGIVFLVLLLNIFLWQLISETLLYFVCKSYHEENVDKSILSSHLEVYLLNDYLPLGAKNVELESLRV